MKTTRRSIAGHILLCLFVGVVIAGCATAKVTDRERRASGKIARPDHILVYDFVATHADVPADSAIAGHPDVQQTSQTAEQIATGRQVGAEIAKRLVEEIRSMGLPAERASARTKLHVNDLMIRGYLLSIEEGSRTKRLTIGFGSGKSELSVAVEGYQMTAQGLRRLGSGTVETGGGKGPGVAAPLAVILATGNPVGLIVGGGMKVYGEVTGKSKIEGRAEQAAKTIADELKPRFREQGWIE